jgi:hypothetical protein
MSKNKLASIYYLFVMGVFFVALGIALMTITETVTRSHHSYFQLKDVFWPQMSVLQVVQIPYQGTIHTYSYESAFTLILGILTLIVGVGMTMGRTAAREVRP